MTELFVGLFAVSLLFLCLGLLFAFGIAVIVATVVTETEAWWKRRKEFKRQMAVAQGFTLLTADYEQIDRELLGMTAEHWIDKNTYKNRPRV